MIRRAVEQDMDGVCKLLAQLHAKSPLQSFPVVWEEVQHMLRLSIVRQSTFVDDDKGKLRGLIIAAVIPLWWNKEVRIGQDIFFYSTRMHAGKQLLEHAQLWCKEHGANWLQFGVSSFKSLDTVAALYLSAGFRREGSFFVKEA